MQKLSVIILAKNEARSIAAAVTSALQVSEDVIVVDSGSTDDTMVLARNAGATILPISWPGFGQARNLGAGAAKNEWLLCIDADEVITPALASGIKTSVFNEEVIYGFSRRNFLGNTEIK